MKIPKPEKTATGYRVRLRIDGQNHYIYATTPAEAKIRAEKYKVDKLLGYEEKTRNRTLHEATGAYIDDRSNILSPSTVMGYRIIQKNRFRAYANKPIQKINWQKAVNEEARLCSPKTLKNAWGFIKSVLKENGIDADVTLPQIVKPDEVFLDYEQIKVFVKAIEGNECEIAFLLALHGLRRSELLALDKSSVKNGMLIIRGSIVPDEHGKMVRKETNKNQSSRRDVPILIPRLADLIDRTEGKLVKCSKSTIERRLAEVCRENGLPPLTPHKLRHSFVSLAYHLQIPELITMQLGGYSDPGTMRRIYTHLAERDKEKSVEKLKDFFK